MMLIKDGKTSKLDRCACSKQGLPTRFPRLTLLSAILLSACQTPQSTQRRGWSFTPGPDDKGALAHSLCVSVETKLLAFGGVDDTKASPLSSQLTIHDSRSGQWTFVDDEQSPAPRNFAAAALMDKSLVIVGGETANRPATSDAYAYDMVQNRWQQLLVPETLIPRKQASLTLVGGNLVLFGGKGPEPVNNWARYEPEHRRWHVLPSASGMEARVSHVALAAGPEALFVWGGFTGQARRGDGFLLELNSGAVERLPPTPMLTARANARALLISQEIFIWGGASSDGRTNSGAAFDLKSRQWRSLPAIPDSRLDTLKGAEIAPWRQGFLLFGGRSGAGAYNDQLWYFDAAQNQWSLMRTNESPAGRIAHCFIALGPDRFALFGGIGYRPGHEILKQMDGIWLLNL